MSSAARVWGKSVGYPDAIDLSRIEAAQRDFPTKGSSFVDWIFRLTEENVLAAHGITLEDYDHDMAKSSHTSGNNMELNVDEELTQIQSFLLSLDTEIKRAEADNQLLQRNLKAISAEKVKQGTSRKDINESAAGKDKPLLVPVEADVYTTKEHEHALRAVSSRILELEPQAGKQLHRLRSAVQDISDVEAALLKQVATSSATFFRDIQKLLIDTSAGDGTTTTTTTATATPQSLDPNSADDQALIAKKAHEYEQELKREAAKRMSDARSRLMEIIFDAKVLESRTTAETEYRKKWIHFRGDLGLINASKLSGSRSNSDASTSDTDSASDAGTSVAHTAATVGTKKTQVGKLSKTMKKEASLLANEIARIRAKLKDLLGKRGPLCDALAEAAEMERKNDILSSYVSGQETIAGLLQSQGDRYQRLIRVQEQVIGHFTSRTREVRVSARSAHQSKKSSENGREYLLGLQTDASERERARVEACAALYYPSSQAHQQSLHQQSAGGGPKGTRTDSVGDRSTMSDNVSMNASAVDVSGAVERQPYTVRGRGRDCMLHHLHSCLHLDTAASASDTAASASVFEVEGSGSSGGAALTPPRSRPAPVPHAAATASRRLEGFSTIQKRRPTTATTIVPATATATTTGECAAEASFLDPLDPVVPLDLGDTASPKRKGALARAGPESSLQLGAVEAVRAIRAVHSRQQELSLAAGATATACGSLLSGVVADLAQLASSSQGSTGGAAGAPGSTAATLGSDVGSNVVGGGCPTLTLTDVCATRSQLDGTLSEVRGQQVERRERVKALLLAIDQRIGDAC